MFKYDVNDPFKPHKVETVDDLPSEDADINELWYFALSFNGYQYAKCDGEDGLEALGGEDGLWDRTVTLLNEGRLDKVSIEDLRACLFWQQRCDRYHGSEANLEDYKCFVDQMREKLVKPDGN
jgi:hypothetical protein